MEYVSHYNDVVCVIFFNKYLLGSSYPLSSLILLFFKQRKVGSRAREDTVERKEKRSEAAMKKDGSYFAAALLLVAGCVVFDQQYYMMSTTMMPFCATAFTVSSSSLQTQWQERRQQQQRRRSLTRHGSANKGTRDSDVTSSITYCSSRTAILSSTVILNMAIGSSFFADPPIDPHIHMPLPAGAIKYEMTPLPDSLVETTIFVGNLGDFVTDDTLSSVFARVATANGSVPGAVARKPNNHSMGYGFVTFRTIQEKEVSLVDVECCVVFDSPPFIIPLCTACMQQSCTPLIFSLKETKLIFSHHIIWKWRCLSSIYYS
jgi:hypothetical protein